MSLARARRPRLRRLRRPREPRPARRRVRRGRPVLPRAMGAEVLVPRGRAPGGDRGRAARACATSSPPGAACARRATRRPTRSRRCSTASSRPGTTKGIKVNARTASSVRCWRSGARRRRRTAASTGSSSASTRRTRDTKRGLVRDEILPLLRRLHPGAERNLLALAEERPRLPRALERTLAELLSSTDGHEVGRPRATASARCASTTSCDSRERSAFGPWRLESGTPGPRRAHAASRRPARGPAQEGAGSLRGREGAEGRARRLAARRLGDEVVAVPGIAEAPGWEGAVRAWKDDGR